MQEHGYSRLTVDVDIIVPNIDFAVEKLSLNGFRTNLGSTMTVTDRETKVEVDLLPGGLESRFRSAGPANADYGIGRAIAADPPRADFRKALNLAGKRRLARAGLR